MGIPRGWHDLSLENGWTARVGSRVPTSSDLADERAIGVRVQERLHG
jgi:hypothetical protein